MVNLLTFDGEEPFATGATTCEFRPATEGEDLSRLMVQVEIGGFPIRAVIDTGAPYVVCPPVIADRLNLPPDRALEAKRLLIRGFTVGGRLYRLGVRFLATAGNDLQLETTAFVPDADDASLLGDLPPFIGLDGCMIRMRFAVDPATDVFFFGPLS